jgi:Mg-chelatase subunit ChlD
LFWLKADGSGLMAVFQKISRQLKAASRQPSARVVELFGEFLGRADMTLKDVCNPDADVLFFPVRHHSPACSRLVRTLIQELRPAAVLIEGPSDFNDRFHELHLPHQLPIAIYSYVRLPQGRRLGAFHPFCVYSPEWQALATAKEIGTVVRFIDLPWANVAGVDEPSHRYGDAEMRRSRYIADLCRRLGVEDFDALWDMLFEQPADLTVQQYLERSHSFCYHMRVLYEAVSPSDLRREAFMAERIVEARREFTGKLLVVTGGFHSYALYARVHGQAAPDSPEPAPTPPPPNPPPPSGGGQGGGPERGIALTPYSYARLDSMTGYEAGMPNPGFYHQVWQQRAAGLRFRHRDLLMDVVAALRRRGQICSTADLIGVETMAQALAAMRGQAEAWRRDLVDAITGTLIKEEREFGVRSPFLEAVHEVFRGKERGRLAEGTSLPPLVRDLKNALAENELEPEMKAREIDLDLLDRSQAGKNPVLHRLRILGVAGFERTGGTDLVDRGDMSRIRERWRLRWSPEFDATAIEAARYGTSLTEAAEARLQERAGTAERDADCAARLLLEACQAGLEDLAARFRSTLEELVRKDNDFFSVASALGHLQYLFCHDEALGARDRPDVGGLLREVYQRGLWLLENLGLVRDRDQGLIAALRTLRDAFERCGDSLSLDRTELVEVLARVEKDSRQAPLLRGAAVGFLWTLGAADMTRVQADLRWFADPDHLGDFLTGLFALARELAQRHPALVTGIDRVVMDFSAEEFLSALPALRLAFTFFTPREKQFLASTLLESLGETKQEPLERLEVGAEDAARALVWEAQVFRAAARFGIRGGAADVAAPPQPTKEYRATLAEAEVLPLPIEPTPSPAVDPRERKARWRLVLGPGAEDLLGDCLDDQMRACDSCLGFLYDREYGAGRNVRRSSDRRGGLEASQLTVPEWINAVHTLFPRKTIERLEKDGLERYQLSEMVTNPQVLERARPNVTLLKAVLHTKHLMNQEVLALARTLVRKVVQELIDKLARTVQSVFLGARNRRRRSYLKVAKNFDLGTTVRRNLAQYNPAEKRIYLKTPYFFSRVRRQVDRWQIIILVDESGSMLDSVIHAAVTASIFFGIPSLRTHLCLFDTNVVDVTADCTDPVETMMKVQLGGGTDIGRALSYAAQLVDNPRRTIVILITDFFEGAPVDRLLSVARQLLESGVTLLGLAALDERAEPNYDRDLARRFVAMGAHVAAMTPGDLAEWVAEKVR